jgi:hypothetical protein
MAGSRVPWPERLHWQWLSLRQRVQSLCRAIRRGPS